MSDYYLGLYEKAMPHSLSLGEKLAETGASGFDFMEISIDETEEKLDRLRWSGKQRREAMEAMWRTGTRIMTMCLSGHRKFPIGSEDEGIRQRGMEIMAEAIELAADLGIRLIQLAGYDEYYRPSNENTAGLFLENLGKSTRMAAKKGVMLAFETMETEFMNTVQKAMHYVNRINSPYLQVYPDLGNVTNAACMYGHRAVEDLETGRGHIAAMHLKETVEGKYREIPYGTGHVDFEAGIRTAAGMGVSLYVGEFWHVGNEDWKAQLRLSNEFLRARFRKALRKDGENGKLFYGD